MTMRAAASVVAKVQATLERAVAQRIAPGLALIVGQADEIVLEAFAGRLDYHREARLVDAHTVYDLSSLTKPLVTVSLVALLVESGVLELERRVIDLLPEFAAPDGDPRERREITVAHLLAHSSGLPAHRRYFADLPAEMVGTPAGAARIIGRASREPIESAPGERATYSDLGFLLLGALIERVSDTALDRLVARRLSEPLGLASTSFRRVEREASDRSFRATLDTRRIAPCGTCTWRGGVVHGVVQDENAYAMGGVAGHAGLFSTVRDVHTLVAAWVGAWLGRTGFFDATLVRKLWTPAGPAGSTWALGWDTPSLENSSAGTRISRHSVGHLGFTGTSVWIDLERQLHVVLLTNRLQPDYGNTAIRSFRPGLHDVIFDAFG